MIDYKIFVWLTYDFCYYNVSNLIQIISELYDCSYYCYSHMQYSDSIMIQFQQGHDVEVFFIRIKCVKTHHVF